MYKPLSREFLLQRGYCCHNGCVNCPYTGVESNMKKSIYVMNDPSMMLIEWKDRIEELIKKFGREAIMYSDAGHNNVVLAIDIQIKSAKKVE